MVKRIRIEAGSTVAEAVLNQTKTAEAIWQALPFEGRVNTWGNEIYFSIPVVLELERGQELVELGDLGYWPTGRAFCIFFGPTPVSATGEIRPASAVTVFGHLEGTPAVLKTVPDGAAVKVARAE